MVYGRRNEDLTEQEKPVNSLAMRLYGNRLDKRQFTSAVTMLQHYTNFDATPEGRAAIQAMLLREADHVEVAKHADSLEIGVPVLVKQFRDLPNLEEDQELTAQHFDDLTHHFANDPRLLMMRGIHRYHRLLNAEHYGLNQFQRNRIANALLRFYSPFVHRSNFYTLYSDMRELALKTLHPDVYDHARSKLYDLLPDRPDPNDKTGRRMLPKNEVASNLQQEGIDLLRKAIQRAFPRATVVVRVKGGENELMPIPRGPNTFIIESRIKSPVSACEGAIPNFWGQFGHERRSVALVKAEIDRRFPKVIDDVVGFRVITPGEDEKSAETVRKIFSEFVRLPEVQALSGINGKEYAKSVAPALGHFAVQRPSGTHPPKGIQETLRKYRSRVRVNDFLHMPRHHYRSLHLKLLGPSAEFQFRNMGQHGVAEFGQAAHSTYQRRVRGSSGDSIGGLGLESIHTSLQTLLRLGVSVDILEQAGLRQNWLSEQEASVVEHQDIAGGSLFGPKGVSTFDYGALHMGRDSGLRIHSAVMERDFGAPRVLKLSATIPSRSQRMHFVVSDGRPSRERLRQLLKLSSHPTVRGWITEALAKLEPSKPSMQRTRPAISSRAARKAKSRR